MRGEELTGLPNPVRRYLRAVLREGQPLIQAARVRHVGTFNLSERGEKWVPFVSEQRVVLQRPGFVWNARMRMLPLLAVRVHDAYADGEGLLQAALLGLFPLMQLHGTGPVAEGQLMRFFAEAAWYPTALLPSQGVSWEDVDEHTATGTLHDGDLHLRLRFRFDADGLLARVEADARGRAVGGRIEPTPWRAWLWDYVERDGMRIPLAGEVAWVIHGAEQPYWRGRITEIAYEFSR